MAVTQPQYFNLLWDQELDDLRGVLEALRTRREDVLKRWHELYIVHFGDTRTLTEPEFFAIFGAELDATANDLLNKDIRSFTAHVRRIGENLSERRVSFSEVIVSMHLFEESACTVFPADSSPKIYQLFDKLSHCRMIVLANAYFSSQTALAGTRIQELEREAAQLPSNQRTRFHGIVGSSAAMRRVYERIEAAGQTRGTVLVVGESGTGKELVARAIHECSPDPGAPFVALNCAALPKDLIESELFGYKRGAFSGANTEYLGLFRAANGGTLFLDEITEMSPETQSKLLRALQERMVRPVGSTREVPVDARLIASTNREPEEAVGAGQLRQDLYYRLQASVLEVPPLRERLEDVALLARHFLVLFNDKLHRDPPVTGIEEDAMEAMKNYWWPGNVRELSNAIEGAFTFGRSSTLRLLDLPRQLVCERSEFPAPVAQLHPAQNNGVATFADVERDLIKRTLTITEGNKARAAKLLRISRKKLYAKIAKYSLE